jgi:hypothetical protein
MQLADTSLIEIRLGKVPHFTFIVKAWIQDEKLRNNG